MECSISARSTMPKMLTISLKYMHTQYAMNILTCMTNNNLKVLVSWVAYHEYMAQSRALFMKVMAQYSIFLQVIKLRKCQESIR